MYNGIKCLEVNACEICEFIESISPIKCNNVLVQFKKSILTIYIHKTKLQMIFRT